MDQARQEITKLNTPTSPRPSTDSSETTVPSTTTPISEVSSSSTATPIRAIPTDIKGKGPEVDPVDGNPSTTPTQPSINAFFSRLQSTIPAQFDTTVITQTIQKHLQPTLEHATTQITSATSQVDLQQIRATITSNIQKVQGVTFVQAEKMAEEYMHKSEALLKEAGEYLKDAVKVVPPDGQEAPSGLMWDGSDIWMFPSPVGTQGWGGGDESSKAQPPAEAQTVSARLKRADALLLRLKHDPSLLRLDPSQDTSIQEKFAQYVEKHIISKGGIENDEWKSKIEATLAEKSPDGDALKLTKEKLGKSCKYSTCSRY